ncbi:MAG: protein TolR [Nitrosomonas sp.]|nr:MAG: protein TolR [Nitrosomonas sp.]
MNEINVVPYIDVMLVLLIIFMITAPMISPGQIELPEIGKSLTPPVAPLEIMIETNGRLKLLDRSKTARVMTIDRGQLAAAIKQIQEQNNDQPVVIAADKNVRYEEVMLVMDILQQHQVKKVGLLARPK